MQTSSKAAWGYFRFLTSRTFPKETCLHENNQTICVRLSQPCAGRVHRGVAFSDIIELGTQQCTCFRKCGALLALLKAQHSCLHETTEIHETNKKTSGVLLTARRSGSARTAVTRARCHMSRADTITTGNNKNNNNTHERKTKNTITSFDAEAVF